MKIELIIILVVGLFSNGHSQNEPVSKTNWKSHNAHNYKISFPADWKLDKNGQMGTNFILFSPLANDEDKFAENISLIIQDLSGYSLDLKQFVEISEGQVKTLITDSEIISSELKNSHERDYHEIIYTGKQGQFNLRFEQYYWVIDERSYILTFTCEEDQFMIFNEISKTILDSFVFEKGGASEINNADSKKN